MTTLTGFINNKVQDLIDVLFYKGASGIEFTAKFGVNANKAIDSLFNAAASNDAIALEKEMEKSFFKIEQL